mmetsp:Transcript_15319/g.46388  ORF Transcript_15319/g.46388 Transcript_15319/m.46388 type:complete len:421 (+) Transcript_15319:152-1414(+)
MHKTVAHRKEGRNCGTKEGRQNLLEDQLTAGEAGLLGREGRVGALEGGVAFGGADGVPGGEVGGGGEEVGGFADGAGGVDGEAGLGGVLVDEDDAEVGGHVVGGGDLVLGGGVGEDGAVFGGELEVLEEVHAEALGVGAFDLADVNRRIDDSAEVHDDVCAESAHVAGEDVQLDFRAADAAGVVVVGVAAGGVGLAFRELHGPVVLVALGLGLVEAVRRETDALEPGALAELREGRARGHRRVQRREALGDLGRRVDGGRGEELVGHARGGRRAVHRGFVGRRLVDADRCERNAEDAGDGLRDLRVDALADLDAAVRHQHGTVRVAVAQRAALLEEPHDETQAKRDGQHADPALSQRIGRVERRDLVLPRREVGNVFALAPQSRHVHARFESLPVKGRGADGQQVHAPDLVRGHVWESAT